MQQTSYLDPSVLSRAFIPSECASLPEPWTKTSLLNLLDETGRSLGLNSTDLVVLRRIAKKTPSSAYSSSTESPICYERQIDMANSLGLSAVQFRRIEAKLHRLGVIRRDTGANGYRGGRTSSYGERSVAGLSLEPLIARLDELLDIKAAHERELEMMAQYRLEISSWRRRLALLCAELDGHPFVNEVDTARLYWCRPRGYRDGEALAAHYFELESMVSQAEEIVQRRKMIAAPIITDRRHIQTTTDSTTESCSNAGRPRNLKRIACKQADTDIRGAAPSGAPCLEKKNVDPSANAKHKNSQDFIASLSVAQIRDLASDDMQLYIDNLRQAGTPRDAFDLEHAGTIRARDLGINPSAYEEAIDTMGWQAALLALIVIDRNQAHTIPKYRIRCPGGTMRAFIREYRRGNLNLQASIFGIWARDEKASRPIGMVMSGP